MELRLDVEVLTQVSHSNSTLSRSKDYWETFQAQTAVMQSLIRRKEPGDCAFCIMLLFWLLEVGRLLMWIVSAFVCCDRQM